MNPVVALLIGIPCAIVIVLGLWKFANVLKRRGIVVRPASTTDYLMTRIERDHAERQVAMNERGSADAGSVKPDA